jgi:hypothetical protein
METLSMIYLFSKTRKIVGDAGEFSFAGGEWMQTNERRPDDFYYMWYRHYFARVKDLIFKIFLARLVDLIRK